MWGLLTLTSIFLLNYFIIGVELEKSIKISCGISFFVFCLTSIQISYKLLTYQLTKIISHIKITELRSKWGIENNAELAIILFQVSIHWTSLALCAAVVYFNGEKFWVCLGSFILISVLMAVEQIMILIHGLQQQ